MDMFGWVAAVCEGGWGDGGDWGRWGQRLGEMVVGDGSWVGVVVGNEGS